MKINIEVDCTPEEARTFLGLPDVKPIQEAMSEHIEERVKTAMGMFEPEALLKAWFPGGGPGLEGLQDLFWGAATGGPKGKSGSGSSKSKKGE
ncbi:MAG: hypothetical protein EP340_01930 [Alphaproteobacteria bacterium]|nr:MAG: hypothetical protein EP340_01930 [Alphaproteobacteria bacterium]